MAIATINPATGEVLRVFEPLSDAQVDEKIALAAATFAEYRQPVLWTGGGWMLRAAEILENEKNEFGRLMTTEMGKTLRSAVDEAAKCAAGCRYYAENAERFLADEIVETGARRSFIRYQPLGPILAVMPWNFPFWQVFRFIAPGLMAGNVGLLKHASNVPQCALAIEDILLRAGFRVGVFQTLLIGSQKVDRILNDPRIMAATLTGSERAGIEVGNGRGEEDQESGAGTGRERSFYCDAEREPRRSGGDRGEGAAGEQRAIVHRGQAVYCGGEHRRSV